MVLAIAGPGCIVALYYCAFYHLLYRDTLTQFSTAASDTDWRLADIERRLGNLEAHKPRRPVPAYVRGLISTVDVAPTTSWPRSDSSRAGSFEIVEEQGRFRIVPELRLRTGSTNEQVFDIYINPDLGTVRTGWLSHTEPYDQLAGMQDFDLYNWYNYYYARDNQTNILHLRARASPGKSVRMEFTAVILLEHDGRPPGNLINQSP